MNFSKLSAFGLTAGLAFASASHAAEFRSTYSETLACPVTEEGEDAFIRECKGPGNVRAVLQYVDGLFGVFYLPMGGKTPMEREDMFEVSPKARHPYGAKLEWRQRVGDATPCVAIIRAYTTKGEVLVLNELATGKRIGAVKSNQQARTLADNACNTPTTKTVALQSENTQSEKPITLPADNSSVVSAARNGKERFLEIYTVTGISGAIEEIEQCYSDFEKNPAATKLAECGAIDLTGADADRSVMGAMPDLLQAYLSKDKPSARINDGINRLGLDANAKQAFIEDLETATGLRVTTANNVRKDSGSVFNFSE